MAKCEKVAIGIDMGTTTCTVGVYQNGQLEIIVKEGGCRPPSNLLAFTEDGKMLGEMSKPQDKNPARKAICDLMKMAGRSYYEKDEAHEMKMVPFRVIDVEGQPAVEALCKKAERRNTPPELSTKILAKVKEMAEWFLEKPVCNAVITVPVYFDENQRKALKEAATNAGFHILRIMNEPIAAAVAYGFLQKEGKQYILMFDLGGGTLDVSVFLVSNGVVDLKATCGDTHLGGKDIDAVIVSHFAKEIKSRYGVDLFRNHQTSLCRLQGICEEVKRVLSTANEAMIKIEGLVQGLNFRSSITRSKFDELTTDLFTHVMAVVEDTLYHANLSKEDISEVVLVGGCSRIPKIQSLLKEYFDGKELTVACNPEEAVAFGAAIEAAVMAKEEAQKTDEVDYETAPLSVGLKTAGGLMAIFVPRNTALPCSFTHEFCTFKDYQPAVLIQVYEGERTMAKDNKHLGDFELKGLPRCPRGDVKIEVTFCMDRSGIIIVTARETTTGVKNAIMITRVLRGRLSRIEVDNMVKDSEKNKQKDEESKSAAIARTNLESYCWDILGCNCDVKDHDYKIVTAKATEALKWLQSNPTATREDIACRHEEIQNNCSGPMAILFRNCEALKNEDDCKSVLTDTNC